MPTCFALALHGGEIPLPLRSAESLSGSEFARKIADLPFVARESEIVSEVLAGNVPGWWRRFVRVDVPGKAESHTDTISYWVAPDYLAVGSDADYLLMPISPGAAERIARRIDCMLPTRKMVDDIYHAAAVKLAPAPVPPSPAMTSVEAFWQHSTTIAAQRTSFLLLHPAGALVAGHKKDMVITNKLPTSSRNVAIYGWHRPDAKPIQPLYTGHTAQWVDYSHGIRFVRRAMLLNEHPATAEEILANPATAALLSDEGPLSTSRYETSGFSFEFESEWSERMEELRFEPGVRAVINSPAGEHFDPAKPTKLILYALPNGNSVEQTMGRHDSDPANWRYEIQHIAAQTRWLRSRLRDVNLVVVYLECAEKSWPAWRRKHDPENLRIARIVNELADRFPVRDLKLILTGHSGGGSFTFGFLNGVEMIPPSVERIAFLDSNYAYDASQGHAEKLARWLLADSNRHLCVLAYNDAVALLEGKPFVSAEGGTWGRSHAMLADLSAHFSFASSDRLDFLHRTALDRRVQFILRENPTRAILHTRMVELNGFIHAMLTGTGFEAQGYEYFGPRVYSGWISGSEVDSK